MSVELTHSNDTIVQGGFVTAMLDSCMAQLVLAFNKWSSKSINS